MLTARLLNLFILILLLFISYLVAADHFASTQDSSETNLTNAVVPKRMCMDTQKKGLRMWCIRDSVFIRSSAEIKDNNMLDHLLMKGEAVVLLAKSCSVCETSGMKGYWYQIVFDGGQEGWVLSDLSEKRPLPPPPALPQSKNAVRELGLLEKIRNYTGIMQNPQEEELVALVEACDFTNPQVRNSAVREATRNKNENEGGFNLGQVSNLYDFAIKNWIYVSDPGSREYVAKASESLLNGCKGDCDDFAVLMFSLTTAIGGEARINYANNETNNHAFTELKVGQDTSKIIEYLSIRYNCPENLLPGFRTDEFGNWWMNLDWFGKPQHPGGLYFDWQYGVSFYIEQKRFEAFYQ